MNFYSQYNEDKIISKFINGSFIGNVLDIGANDGKTLSNSLHFIENGWGATLIEASPVCFKKLNDLHRNNQKIQNLNYCLSNENKKFTFYHNKTHLRKGDTDLLSTISEENYVGSKKSGNDFEIFEIDGVRFDSIKKELIYDVYDLISIDIEGYDFEILSQINLQEIKCKILVIEYNSIQTLRNKIINYCEKFDLKNVLHDNSTNLILVR